MTDARWAILNDETGDYETIEPRLFCCPYCKREYSGYTVKNAKWQCECGEWFKFVNAEERDDTA